MLPSEAEAADIRQIHETKPDPAAAAMRTAAQAAREAALKPGADFERCAAYVRRLEDLAGRWERGEPAHTPKKSSPSA